METIVTNVTYDPAPPPVARRIRRGLDELYSATVGRIYRLPVPDSVRLPDGRQVVLHHRPRRTTPGFTALYDVQLSPYSGRIRTSGDSIVHLLWRGRIVWRAKVRDNSPFLASWAPVDERSQAMRVLGGG